MDIRTEVHQAILDARLLEIDVFSFLNKEADWGDDCPLTNFKTKHSLYGYHAHYFSIGTNLYSGNEFDYKLYHEVLYTAAKVFVRERLLYYWYGNSTQLRSSHLILSLRILEDTNKFVSPLLLRWIKKYLFGR